MTLAVIAAPFIILLGLLEIARAIRNLKEKKP